MKVYQKKTRSVEAVNALFAQNLTKRLKHRKKTQLKIKELPPRKGAYLTDDSLKVEPDNTFDRLLRGKVYNEVKLDKFPVNKSTDSEASKSKVQVSVSYHSPIMTRTRKKSAVVKEMSVSKSQSLQKSLPKVQKGSTLITSSLSIEKENKNGSGFGSLSYIKLPKITENQVLDNIQIFSDTFRQSQAVHSSTPYVAAPSKKIVNDSISPITKSDSSDSSKLIEKSYDHIQKWDQMFPNLDEETPKKAPRRGPRRKLSIEGSKKDWKLICQPKVYVKDVLRKRRSKRNGEDFRGFNEEEQLSSSEESYLIRMFLEGVEKRRFAPRKSLRGSESVLGLSRNSGVMKRKRGRPKKVKEKESESGEKTEQVKKGGEEKTEEMKKKKRGRKSRRELEFKEEKEDELEEEKTADELKESQKVEKSEEIKEETKSEDKEETKAEDEEETKSEDAKEEAKSGDTEAAAAKIEDTKEDEDTEEAKIEDAKEESKSEIVLRTRGRKSTKEPDKSEDIIEESPDAQVKKRGRKSKKMETKRTSMKKGRRSKRISKLSHKSADRNLRSSIVKKSKPRTSTPLKPKPNRSSHVTQRRRLPARSAKLKPCNVTEEILSEKEMSYSSSDHSSIEFSSLEKKSLSIGLETFEDFFTSHTESETSFETKPRPEIITVSDESLERSSPKMKKVTIDSFLSKSLEFQIAPKKIVDDSRRKSESSKIIILSNITLGQSKSDSIRNVLHDHSYCESPKVRRSDIVETSFVAGKRVQWRDPMLLKPGKGYKRELSMKRRTSTASGKIGRTSVRRTSVFVPISRNSGNKSILEAYAEASYVQEEPEDQLDSTNESIRSVSLRKSSINFPLTAEDVVLRRCGQAEILDFEECYPESALQHCQKIGEGVYGEVFLYRDQNGGTSVMKIIPIEGDLIVNGEKQKKFEEILSEIVIAMELSNLRTGKKNMTAGFSEVKRARCIRGPYPEKLIDLWDLYAENKLSENDSPQMFPENQMYIILEFANAGKDLESFVFNNAAQAFAMFKQTACALAVAESSLKFEHRDLHWGNVLLKEVDKKKSLHIRFEGRELEVQTFGVEVTIIDFTLSRIESDGIIIYNDLSTDPELFEAQGDYQFDIYRLMQKRNRNSWQHFEPYTNILWLHYILDKAVKNKGLRYKNPGSKIHKDFLEELKLIKDEILKFNSVTDFVSAKFF